MPMLDWGTEVNHGGMPLAVKRKQDLGVDVFGCDVKRACRREEMPQSGQSPNTNGFIPNNNSSSCYQSQGVVPTPTTTPQAETLAPQHPQQTATPVTHDQLQKEQAPPDVARACGGVMDLCDETYSHVGLSEDVDQMDTDCVPDPQQFKPSLHQSYCGGERSPSSGQVRCYCKPGWEAMLGPVPYMSDFY